MVARSWSDLSKDPSYLMGGQARQTADRRLVLSRSGKAAQLATPLYAVGAERCCERDHLANETLLSVGRISW